MERDRGKRIKVTLARSEVRAPGKRDSLGPADKNLLGADRDWSNLRHDNQCHIVGPHLNHQNDCSMKGRERRMGEASEEDMQQTQAIPRPRISSNQLESDCSKLREEIRYWKD